MLQMLTVTWYPLPLPLALNGVPVRALTVTLHPSEAWGDSHEETNVPGIGQLYSALKDLCRTACSPGNEEVLRNHHDLVGVLNPPCLTRPKIQSHALSSIAEWAIIFEYQGDIVHALSRDMMQQKSLGMERALRDRILQRRVTVNSQKIGAD